MKPLTYLTLAVLGIALGAVGYFAGKSGKEPSATPIQAAQPQTEKPQTEKPQTDVPRKITPETIAKAKNVPATLKQSQGEYTLVTVLEGADANRHFNQSLQVITAQRRRLATLAIQFDKTPADSVPQRELIRGQINETQKNLEGDLRLMAKNYGYSLKKNYVKVTHAASLLSVTEEDGKTKTEIVYAFKNAQHYDDFKNKRDVYVRLKLEQAKAAQATKKDAPPAAVLVENGTATPVPASNPVAEQDGKLKPTPEIEEKSKELQQIYMYDPEKNYQIRLEKTALYARAARLKNTAKSGSNLGKQAGDTSRRGQTNPRQTGKPVQKTTNPTPQTPQNRVITPEMIAKAKNVPAKLSSPQGDFTLVSVVEGAESNRSLNQGLQIIGAQRKRLAVLSQQFEKTPVDYLQQRELIAGQIHETKKSLENNVRFMAQNFNYSVKNNYVQIPHQASLLFITKVDGVAKAEKVYTLKNSAEYEDYQKKRDLYLRLTVEQFKAAQAARKNTANLKPTPEMVVISKELKRLYKYDPVKNYKISLEKTALYARPAR